MQKMIDKKENYGYERISNGKKIVILPDKLKKELVSKIEAKEMTIEQVALKYNVKCKQTINNWLVKYDKNKKWEKPEKRTRYTISEKIRIVAEHDEFQCSIIDYCEQYKINPSTLRKWKKLYSCSSNFNPPFKMRKTKEEEKAKINNELKNQKELEEAKLKIAGLETMIDLAEREFKISIRKKSGTKQL
jgi:transposase-like protein